MRTSIVRLLVAAVVVLALGSACRSPVDVDGTVTVSITGSSLTIDNGTASTIYYTAYVEPPGTVLDWTVCNDPHTCPSVPPRREVVRPVPRHPGIGEPTDEVIVVWWRLVPGPGFDDYRALQLHWLTVRP